MYSVYNYLIISLASKYRKRKFFSLAQGHDDGISGEGEEDLFQNEELQF